VVTGYNNTITDEHFTLQPGESANYSTGWYQIRANDGVYIQKANTTSKENEMMGNSTNHILLDMANLLVNIITYLQTIETAYNNHIHIGVMPSTPDQVSGVPQTPWIAPPVDTDVTNDIPRLTNGQNLAGTNFTPYL
jgi:hypothetical protein